ncbi:MAG: ankyrin repeat domain-containing protein [Bacilli bacterium]|nr:ankyrin repeat domain-containing protein [Bacilli bacterium]
MIEKLVELVSNEDWKNLKTFIKKNYDEIGEFVYTACVGFDELEDENTRTIILGIIVALLSNGHKLDYVDSNGNSALLGAIKSQNEELVFAFNGADNLFTLANNDKITPVALSYTLENNNIKLFCTMRLGDKVNDIFPVNGENMTYFSLAIFTSDFAICKAIAMNDNFDYNIHKKFLDDIEWDDSEDDEYKKDLINRLESGEKIELEDVEEYEPGEENSDLEVMHQGLSPLMIAILQNNNDEVRNLIKNGAKVNYRNTAGFTPLMCAIFKDNYEIAKYLIEQGAFVNCRIYNGLTPLLKSFLSENGKIFELLLDNNVYISEMEYNLFNNMENKSDNQKKLIELVNKYNNPQRRKQIFPYEYKYELGYNETYEGDGYYKVCDVFSEKYGTNMINSYDYLSPFGKAPVFNLENHKSSGDGVMFRGPSEIYKGANFAVLFKNGKVKKFDFETGKSTEVFKGHRIVQIESTNYNIVGLTDKGTVLIDNNKFTELNEVTKWNKIKKIAVGNASIYGITEDGDFKYVLSKIDEVVIKKNLLEAIKSWKDEKFKFKDISAHVFHLGIVTTTGNVRLISSNVSSADSGLINNISDAEQISVNNHFVILRKDKTLLAFGNNNYNQCNIAKWHDIERIQATYFCTVGYATNGEILCTECMHKSDKGPLAGFMGSALWPEGFGNAISMGQFVPDAIQINAKGTDKNE